MDKEGKTRTPMEWSLLNRSNSSTTLAQLTHPTQTNQGNNSIAGPPNKLQLLRVSILAIPTPAVYLQWLWHPPVPVMFRSVPPSASEKMAGISWQWVVDMAQGDIPRICFAKYGNSEVINQMVPFRQVYVNMCTVHYQLYMWYVYKQYIYSYLEYM